jgi:hypothetical protein
MCQIITSENLHNYPGMVGSSTVVQKGKAIKHNKTKEEPKQACCTFFLFSFYRVKG